MYRFEEASPSLSLEVSFQHFPLLVTRHLLLCDGWNRHDAEAIGAVDFVPEDMRPASAVLEAEGQVGLFEEGVDHQGLRVHLWVEHVERVRLATHVAGHLSHLPCSSAVTAFDPDFAVVALVAALAVAVSAVVSAVAATIAPTAAVASHQAFLRRRRLDMNWKSMAPVATAVAIQPMNSAKLMVNTGSSLSFMWISDVYAGCV